MPEQNVKLNIIVLHTVGNIWTRTTIEAILNADNLEEFQRTEHPPSGFDAPDFMEDIKLRPSPRVMMSHLRYLF